MVRELVKRNFSVIVLDNLVSGHKQAIVDKEVVFIEGDLGNKKLVTTIFEKYSIQAVMHFAAFVNVGESVNDPIKYYENNVASPIFFLDVMKRFSCQYFIFSSTCATYGTPQKVPIDESHPQNPINPYGSSKLMLEQILKYYDKAHNIKHANLRYFNACGAYEDGFIGEEHNPETHLIPLVLLTAKGERENICIFGTDYETPDGTCIRDYIHILDLANAHIKALEYLKKENQSISVNLGNGKGHSVKEIIETCKKVTKKDIPVIYGKRREGDPPKLVANPSKANQILNWKPIKKDITTSITDAWKWLNSPHRAKFKQR